MSEEKDPNINPEIEMEELTEEKLSEQRLIRREKLKKLQEAGRNPFLIEKWNTTAYSQEIKDNFDEMDGKEVTLAGRIMAKRGMGKASFVDLQDDQGRIQCHVKKDVLGDEEYDWFKTYDIGDILGVVGVVFRTKRGEITVEARQVVLMSKSLQVLPNKWHGLKDVDIRYRQRYVDLIMNPEVKQTFIMRSKIIKEIKRVLRMTLGIWKWTRLF